MIRRFEEVADDLSLRGKIAGGIHPAIGQEAATLDAQILEALAAMLSPGGGERLAAVFATAPSAAVHRHLWRLLVQCERHGAADEVLGVTVFALPVIIVAGIEGEHRSPVTLTGVLEDAPALAAISRRRLWRARPPTATRC